MGCGDQELPKKVVEKKVTEKKEKGKYIAKCPFCGEVNLRKVKHCEHFHEVAEGQFIFRNTELTRR